MVELTDHQRSRRVHRHLRMAFQAEIVVALDQHLVIDRTMWFMTDDATFANCLVFENEWPGLLAMALGAAFVHPCHGQAAVRLEDVQSVRVVTLHAIHASLDDSVMLRQPKLRMHIQVTFKTSSGIFAWIDYGHAAPTARLDVKTPRSMTGFASAHSFHACIHRMQPGMRTGRKGPGDVGVAAVAHLIADVGCSWNGWSDRRSPIQR